MLTAKELAVVCAKAAEETKAEDIRVLDVRGISSLTDYCVICTVNSVPHLRAVLRDVDGFVQEKAGVSPEYRDTNSQSLWGVLDYIDVMVHVMCEETRVFYGLEEIWKDASEILWQEGPLPVKK